MTKRGLMVCLVSVVAMMTPVVMATNGMNMIAYDAVAAGMAGADAAVDTGCTAVAANPANMSTICESSLVVNASLLSPDLHFENMTYGGSNDLDGESQLFPLPFVGYATKVGGDLALGLGLFAQGGMGVDFDNVATNFGTEDKMYSNVRYLRFAPTASYKFSDRFSLGLTLHLGYSDLSYEFFPNTSFFDPGADGSPGTADDMVFPGQNLDGAASYGFAARLGFRYQLSGTVTIGGTYTSESELDYDDGDLDMNFSSMGLGKVRYNGSVAGFTWPAAAEFGIAFKLLDSRLTLAADAQWINWSGALETVTVKGTSPNNEYAPPDVEIPFVFDWDDQMVYSIGAAYAISERGIVRAGFNFGESPIEDEFVYPLFPATVEQHLTLGYGHTINNISIDVAYEHGFENEITNRNADPMVNPFGPDDITSHSQNTVHMMFTYRP